MMRLVLWLTTCLLPVAAVAQGPVTAPQAAEALGARLTVRAVQGTPGGPPIRDAEAIIRLDDGHGNAVHTFRRQLDERGEIHLHDLALRVPIQPIVEIMWAGVAYRRTGPVLDAEHPEQAFDIVCYETTRETPDWSVSMRHVMVEEAPDGLSVTEVLVLENPGRETWLGDPVGIRRTRSDRPVPTTQGLTALLALPGGARDVTLSTGFHGWCCAGVDDGHLANYQPLMPGSTELRYSYLVPAHDGAATVSVAAPADVAHLMVIVPATLQTAAVNGLTDQGDQPIAGRSLQVLLAQGQRAGDLASVVVKTAGAGNVAPPTDVAALIRPIAAIGGFLLLVAAAIVVARSNRGKEAVAS